MKRVIVSGFFNPLHGGHLDLIEAAKTHGDYLIVIVNNDIHQMVKKGKIILDENNRARLVGSLKPVDEVVIGIDPEDPTWPSTKTLELIANKYPDDELIFSAVGGSPRRHVRLAALLFASRHKCGGLLFCAEKFKGFAVLVSFHLFLSCVMRSS